MSDSEWQEINFSKENNVFWFELEEEQNAIYSVLISGSKSRVYGKPSSSPIVYVYNENMTKIIESSENEKPLLIELDERNKKVIIQVILSLGEIEGNCYIKMEKVNMEDNIYYKKKDKQKVQEFNRNPFKFLNKD